MMGVSGTHHLVAQDKLAPADVVPEFQFIPSNAVGFAHIRVADIWASPAMKETRKYILKAGPVAFDTLDADFTPAPSTLDRVTMVLLPNAAKDQVNFSTVTILRFNKPYDAAKVTKQYMPNGKKLDGGTAGSFVADRISGIAIHFADAQTIVFGDEKTMPQYMDVLAKAGKGGMQTAFADVAGKDMYATINLASLAIPEQFKQDVPFEFRPLLKAERMILTVETRKETRFTMQWKYGSKDDATAGAAALRKATELGRAQLVSTRRTGEEMVQGKRREAGAMRPVEELPQALYGMAILAGMNSLDELLSTFPVKVDDTLVTSAFDIPSEFGSPASATMIAAGLIIPALQRVRASAAHITASNNLKQLALAMHNHESAFGKLPAAAICDKSGKPLLSWRVAILPYIEQDNLYRQFKLDEPWDSANNKPLSEIVVKVFSDPRIEMKPGEQNRTYYKVFTGGGAAFDVKKGQPLFSITDGTSNTVMIAAAGEPVIWSKPEDFEFDPKKALPNLKTPFAELIVAVCDGSIRTFRPEKIKDFESIMKLLIQANDGQVIPNFDE